MIKILLLLILSVVSLQGFLAAESDRDELLRQKEALHAAIKIQPNDAELWMKLGFLQKDLGEWDEALANFQKVIEIDPQKVKAYYLVALIKERKIKAVPAGDRERVKAQAIQAWEKCLQVSEDAKVREVAQKHLNRLKASRE
ncbi:MAG: tetratricopeptide repeat protein [Elusimicrobia bacterium]|nr:tetratricopeptide repeat protein [Elusimicrobiota bacterium]